MPKMEKKGVFWILAVGALVSEAIGLFTLPVIRVEIAAACLVAGVALFLMGMQGSRKQIGDPSPTRPIADRAALGFPPARQPVQALVVSGTTATPPAVASASLTKPCPDCAEDVRAAARKCRFCG
ncbi:MAG: hypothetical protein ACXVQJ_04835 [Actinomycetota bacterium]